MITAVVNPAVRKDTMNNQEILEIITQYPIGSQVILDDEGENDEPHKVAGYKKIKENYYLLFNDGGMVVVERAI